MTPLGFDWSVESDVCMYIHKSVYMYIQGVYIYIQVHPYKDKFWTKKGRDFSVFKQKRSTGNIPFKHSFHLEGFCIYG